MVFQTGTEAPLKVRRVGPIKPQEPPRPHPGVIRDLTTAGPKEDLQSQTGKELESSILSECTKLQKPRDERLYFTGKISLTEQRWKPLFFRYESSC